MESPSHSWAIVVASAAEEPPSRPLAPISSTCRNPTRQAFATSQIPSSQPSSSNPVVPAAYYRAVAEVDGYGNTNYTDGNAYSGDNGRAAIKGENGLYYMVGNDNSGNLTKSEMLTTYDGIDLVNATGV